MRARLLLILAVALAAGLAATAGTTQAVVRPPGQDEEAKADIRAAMGAKYPELTSVLERLIDDKAHPLNMVAALLNPSTRPKTIALLSQLAAGRTLCGRSLQEFLREHPGAGPLFEKLPDDANFDATGRSRKTTFLSEAKATDAARRVGANPNEAERALVEDYAKRLRSEVEPSVFREVQALTREVDDAFGGKAASFSVRTKTAEGIIDKVKRLDNGRTSAEDDPADLEGPGPQPGAQVGDLIDAVGARITVQNTAQLALLLQRVMQHFGTGDAGRIIEIENFYLSPKARSLPYRVIPLAVVVKAGALRYTFELQLTTRRASVAADLNHNTVYKNLIEASPAEHRKVKAAFSEAAAIEQLESRGEHPPSAPCGEQPPKPPLPPPPPRPAAGTFVLVDTLTQITNTHPQELTIDPVGETGELDHTGANGGAGNGGDWKIHYSWKVPRTLIAGKTASITLGDTISDVNPNQPLSDSINALAPDFAQQLIVHYPPSGPSSQTYAYKLAADQAGAKEITITIGFTSSTVVYHYRPTGR